MYDQEQANLIRALVMRGVVRSTNDRGRTQVATVTTHRHVDRSDVEIALPFGLASNPPGGGQIILLPVGGDQGDLVGLPIGNPSARLGNLKTGEAALYSASGSRLHLKQQGKAELTAADEVTIKAGEYTITVSKGLDRLTCRRSSGERFVLRPGYAKMRTEHHHLVVQVTGITVSAPPVVGPDPEPHI